MDATTKLLEHVLNSHTHDQREQYFQAMREQQLPEGFLNSLTSDEKAQYAQITPEQQLMNYKDHVIASANRYLQSHPGPEGKMSNRKLHHACWRVQEGIQGSSIPLPPKIETYEKVRIETQARMRLQGRATEFVKAMGLDYPPCEDAEVYRVEQQLERWGSKRVQWAVKVQSYTRSRKVEGSLNSASQKEIRFWCLQPP